MASKDYKVDNDCIFCKIVKGDISSNKLVETDTVFAFLDIQPLSKGHALIVPKHHGAKLHDIPDEYLTELMPTAKKIAEALGTVDYNILQNNGRIAHQVVDHVHVHVIPKPSDSDKEGLVVGWPNKESNKKELEDYAEELRSKLQSKL